MEEEKEENLYFDSQYKEWKIGNCKTRINTKNDEFTCVSLPLLAISMYPVDYSNLIYATCCLCGKSIEYGQICIVFTESLTWGIRIRCCKKDFYFTSRFLFSYRHRNWLQTLC